MPRNALPEPGSLVAHGVAMARGERRLFDRVGFALSPGGALILSGPNGSGKSSLLRLIAGFGRQNAGRFTWNGADIAGDPESHRERLHYVGHQDSLKPALTVGETIRFWQALAGRDDGSAEAALAAFGLGHLAALPCRFLSAGQRRRVALARTAAWDAPLWLLDEPTVGLDSASLALLFDRIQTHREAGGSVILSTHQETPLAGVQHLSLADFPPAAVSTAAALDW